MKEAKAEDDFGDGDEDGDDDEDDDDPGLVCGLLLEEERERKKYNWGVYFFVSSCRIDCKGGWVGFEIDDKTYVILCYLQLNRTVSRQDRGTHDSAHSGLGCAV